MCLQAFGTRSNSGLWYGERLSEAHYSFKVRSQKRGEAVAAGLRNHFVTIKWIKNGLPHWHGHFPVYRRRIQKWGEVVALGTTCVAIERNKNKLSHWQGHFLVYGRHVQNGTKLWPQA